MTITATKVGQATHLGMGIGFVMYTITWDASLAAGGEDCDLSAVFTTIKSVQFNGVMPAKTQRGYKLVAIGDAKTGGIDPATLKITAYQAAGTEAVFDEADTVDLRTTCAAAPMMVIGVLK
jgi:hypothetical protein